MFFQAAGTDKRCFLTATAGPHQRLVRPKPISRHVIILVRKCTCLWNRRRWHKHVVTLVRFLITGPDLVHWARQPMSGVCGSSGGGITR